MKKRFLLVFSLLLLTTVFVFRFIPEEKKTKTSNIATLDPVAIPPSRQLEVERDRDQPHLAMQMEYEMTKDRNLGYTPTDRLVKAYREMKAKMDTRQREASAIPGVTWTERGPNNIGGRTRTVMFDPNDSESKKVWSGSTSGGLWSIEDVTDPEATWKHEDGIMTNLAISSMAYDPTNIQTFYLGTGQGYTGIVRGAGIWKSTDGGTSWDQLASTTTSDFFFVQKIEINAQGVIFAATATGLHRSADGGSTWTQEISGLQGDIEIASDGTIYTTQGINSTGRIFKSTDAGLNFTEITPVTGGLRTELAVSPTDPDIVYAVADGGAGSQDVEYMMRTVDGGTTWTELTIPNYSEQDCTLSNDHYTRGQAFFDLILAVHPSDPNIVFAGGINVHRSLDGGQTWELISYWTGLRCDDYVHPDIHDLQFSPSDANIMITGSDGGVDFTPNILGNPDFQRRVRGLNTVQFYSAAMTNVIGSNVMIAGAQDNGTQRFTEFGMNSTVAATGGDGGFAFINPNDPNMHIASFVRNTYDMSTDGGLTFSEIHAGSDGRFINPTDVDWETGVLYAASAANEYGRLGGLLDNPGGFVKVDVAIDGQISAVKVSPHTSNRIFIGTRDDNNGGRLFMIDDAHTTTFTLTEITGNMPNTRGGFLRSIDVGASDDQLLVTFSNFGATSVVETTDGGTTWIDKEDNLPDIPVRWGLYNPNDTKQVLLATDLGVWSTSDITADNPAWEVTNEGLASVRVDQLIYRSSDETIAAATFGRGLFTSNIFATTVRADFKTEQIVGYVGIPVEFEDGSLLPDDSWSWNFGDGKTSTLQNPSNTYDSPGTYDVSLTIAGGTDEEVKAGYVTILPVIAAPYAAADGGDFESNPDHFTSKSLRNNINLWERGTPGNVLTNPASGSNVWKTKLDTDIGNEGFTHSSALYTPAFDLSDLTQDYTFSFDLSMHTRFSNLPIGMQVHYSLDGGINWFTLGNAKDQPGDENWYNRDPNNGTLIVQQIFEDQIGWTSNTTNGESNLTAQTKLNFLKGETNVSFRFITTVTHIGSAQGYEVDGFMVDDVEILATDPTADFGAERTFSFVGKEIQFNYNSSGASSFLWDFGDNNTSTEQDPKHTYAAAGSYDVSLTINPGGAEVTETKTDFIKVGPNRSLPYLLADGGNFEENQDDFSPISLGGTQFELGSSTVSGKDGTASGDNAWVTGINESLYLDNSSSRLISPQFDFSDQAKVYTLEFKSKFNFEDEWDGFIIRYSTDAGGTFTKLNNNMEDGWYNQISDPSSVFGSEVPIFSGDTGGEFLTFSTDVTFLFGNQVVFDVLFLSDANEVEAGMAFDDFQIILEDISAPTADFTFEGGDGCTGQDVVFTNASTGTIDTYTWDFGDNATPATATGEGPHTVTYSGTGLSTPSLTVSNTFDQSDVETKTDAVTTAANHTPTFTEENNGDRNVARLVASDGDAYQWLNGSTEIEGATEQTYLATEIANYRVRVTVDGCIGTSAQQQIITANEDDIEFERGISIYPNPVQEIMNVKVSNSHVGEIRFKLHTITGATILEKTVSKTDFDAEYKFSLSGIKAGTYLIEIVSDEGRVVKRISKQED